MLVHPDIMQVKLEGQGQSSWPQQENMAQVVGATLQYKISLSPTR